MNRERIRKVVDIIENPNNYNRREIGAARRTICKIASDLAIQHLGLNLKFKIEDSRSYYTDDAWAELRTYGGTLELKERVENPKGWHHANYACPYRDECTHGMNLCEKRYKRGKDKETTSVLQTMLNMTLGGEIIKIEELWLPMWEDSRSDKTWTIGQDGEKLTWTDDYIHLS